MYAFMLAKARYERHKLGRPQEIQASVAVVVGERTERFWSKSHAFMQAVATIRVKLHGLVDPAHAVDRDFLHEQLLFDEFAVDVGLGFGSGRCCCVEGLHR